MAMMERLLLQVLERKNTIVGQVKHQARLFDQHLASALLIDGIDPPDWLLPSHPPGYKRDDIMLELFQRPSRLSVPGSSCCRPVNEETLVNDEQLMVDSCDDNLGSMIETCDGGTKLSVLPEDAGNCESGARHGTEFMALSPNVQNMEGAGKNHHDLELSLASLQRSKTRQKALELRSSAKASQSRSQGEINENSVGGRIATSGIRTDAPLEDAADGGEVRGISHERIPIRELSSENRISVDEPGVCSLFKDSGVDMPLTKSLAGPDCTIGEASNTHAEVKVFVKKNLGDASIVDFRSNDCSDKVLKSQRSTCSSDVDNVLEFDGNLHGEKSKTYDEQMAQSIPVDHLQEDQNEDEVCQETQHESVSECLMDSRRFSEVAYGNKIVDMDNSSKIGEFSVERSGTDGQASKTSEPLILLGCQSVEARPVVFSQCVSASTDNQPNIQGCNTDLERYVEDSAGGSLPSSSPVEVVSLGKSETDADHLIEKDMEVFAPSSFSHPEILLHPKQLKFANLRDSVVGINMDSVMISEEKIHSCSPLRQTSIKPTDHKKEENFGDLDDHPEGTIQLNTLPKVIVESSLYPGQEEEEHINPASNGGESLKFISSLSSDRIDDRKKTSLGEQEQTCVEEKNQPNALCSEEGHIEPDLQESNVMGFPSSQFSDFLVEDQNIPEIEGFVITTDDDDRSFISEDGFSFRTLAVENVTVQNGRVLELLGLSASLKTPLQQPFIGNTDNRNSRLYQTVPNGLLENVDLRSSLALNDGDQVDHAIDGRSYSDCLPYAEAASTLGNRKPYASPVGKLWESVHANSGSSKHKSSSIPELPCISEEIEFADEAVDGLDEIICVKMASAKREPLAEISEDPNIPMSNDGNEFERCSLDSTMIETTFSTANERLRVKHKAQESRKGDFAMKIKSSKAFEKGPNGVNREVKSPRNKLSHPKTCMEEGGSGISRKKSKLNNIVSSMTSFLPFVQQKQAAAPCAGKRNVKVKALEAAEAAKRQAEKKEMERKMKKEALKLERERVEKENMIRMELEKKRKDEERKKKEAEVALKKRLREEEYKREKEKKRRHIKEPRKNAWDRQETSCTDRRELPDTKDLGRDAELTEKTQSGVGSGQQLMDHEDRKVDGPDNLSQSKGISIQPSFGTFINKIQHDLREDNGNLEPSYDISPYKCSDDEDEEEEDAPNEKSIPSWARKGNIAKDVFSQQNLDPDVIFPPDSFCSISEVVMPLKYQLKLRAGAGAC